MAEIICEPDVEMVVCFEVDCDFRAVAGWAGREVAVFNQIRVNREVRFPEQAEVVLATSRRPIDECLLGVSAGNYEQAACEGAKRERVSVFMTPYRECP